jgi:hypothetical protein
MGAKIRIAEGVIHKNVGDEVILLDLDRGVYYGLDSVGARIWDLLQAGHAAGEVVETLLSEYEVTRAEAEQDVAALIEQLAGKGLLRTD